MFVDTTENLFINSVWDAFLMSFDCVLVKVLQLGPN